MSKYALLRWNSGVNALIFLLLGVLLLIFPIESLSIGGYLIASILMLGGIGYLIKIIQNKGIETNGDIIYLIISVAAIALSIFIFINPTWIIRIINVFVGIILIVSSLMNLKDILKFKQSRTISWWIYLSIIILVFIAGCFIIYDPLFLAKIITRIEGASLIINTAITLLLSRKVNKLLLEVKQ